MDVILCPAYVGVAATLGSGQYWLYTAIWNVLDQPCVAFPTGLKVDSAIDVVEDYEPRSEEDDREYRKCQSSFPSQLPVPNAFLDVPETFVDAPIALQLVGKRFRDEETVAATELVSKIVQS